MAHIHRLIVAALLLCCSLVAQAAFPLQTVYIGITTGASYSSPEDACVDGGRGNDGNKHRTFSRVEDNPLVGLVCKWYDPVFQGEVGAGVVNRTSACPANSVQQGSACECQTGFHPRAGGSGTICVKPDDRNPQQYCEDWAKLYNSTLTPDKFARSPGPLSAWADGALSCRQPHEEDGFPAGQGCKHWFTGDLGFQDDNGQWWTNGYSVALDAKDPRAEGSLVCSLTDKPKEEKPDEDCKHGYKGTVNGVEVCVEAWTGDTDGRDWDRHTESDGSITDVQRDIKCKGDQCEIKETRTNKKPDGTTTTTTNTTPNVSRQGYCSRNPESAICGRDDDPGGRGKGEGARGGGGGGKGEGNGDGDGDGDEPSSFGGSCLAGFQCEGDAIQCAIAREQHIRACKLFDDKDYPEYALYLENKDKTGKVTDTLEGNRDVNIAGIVSSVDQFLGGGGSCPADPAIAFRGHTITVPYSKLCPYLAIAGNVLVIVAAFVAARIILRRD